MALSNFAPGLLQPKLLKQTCCQRPPLEPSAFKRLPLSALPLSITDFSRSLSQANLHQSTKLESPWDVFPIGAAYAHARGVDAGSVSGSLLLKSRTGPHRLLRKNSSSQRTVSYGSKGPTAATADVSTEVSTATELPPFLPKEAELLEDPHAKEMAKRIRRLPVMVSFATPHPIWVGGETEELKKDKSGPCNKDCTL